MKLITIIVLFISAFTLSGQTRYAKIIDFDGVPQGARQIVPYGDEYFVSYYQVCINRAGNLVEVCGGLLKIDDLASIADSNLIREFSVSFNSVLADDTRDKLYFCGEPNIDNNYAQEFFLGEVNPGNLSEKKFKSYKIPIEQQINYFQTASTMFNEGLFLGGTSQIKDQNKVTTIGIYCNDKLSLDTFWVIDLGISSILRSSYKDVNNRLVLHIASQIGITRYSHILKFDTSFQQVWHWSSEVSNNQQLPYGCQLSDGKTLVAMT
ncbi:MAG: hypothetical protein WAT79_15570, partial [Saprospiraceae bacterium]